MALVGDPELLFLDEPTTGFDPSARRQAWEVIAGLRELGKTVFLTTHYMDEAQRLADRVAIIAARRDRRPRARRRTSATATSQPATISFRPPDGAARSSLRDATTPGRRRCTELTGAALTLDRGLASSRGPRGDGGPSLEDVYLELTAEQAE